MKAIDQVREKFKSKIISVKEKTSGRIYLEIFPGDIREIVSSAYNNFNLRFITASGTDSRSQIDIIYHL